MPFPPGQYGVGGPQSKRPLPMAPIAFQRPGAVHNGHARDPVISRFLQTYIPRHPLSSPPKKTHRTVYEFPLAFGDRQELMIRLWEELLAKVGRTMPGRNPASLFLPRKFPDQSTDPSRETYDMVMFIKDYDWSLKKCQEELASQARSRPAGSSHPSTSTSSAANGHWQSYKGSVCGHVIRKGEAFYRYCAHDDTCVQCAACFNASNHEGHDIVFAIASDNNGCCDCGDAEAWKYPLGCHLHDSPSTLSQPLTTSHRSSQSVPSDEGMMMESQMSQDSAMGELPESVPAAVVEAFQNHFTEILDMILDTLEWSPDRVGVPTATDAVRQIERFPSMDPFDPVPALSMSIPPPIPSAPPDRTLPSGGYHTPFDPFDAPGESFASSPADTADDEAMDESEDGMASSSLPSSSGRPHDDSSDSSLWGAEPSSADSCFGLGAPTGPWPPGGPRASSSRNAPRPRTQAGSLRPRYDQRFFALLVWNDELHDYPSVMNILSDVTGRTLSEAKLDVDQMDDYGRATLSISTDVEDMLMAALQISAVNLAVSIRPAYDAIAEDVAAMLWDHLIQLVSCPIFVGNGQSFVPHSALLRTILTDQMMRRWEHMFPTQHERMSSEFFPAHDLRKLDGLLILESKLPKKARMQLKELLLICMASKEKKEQIALRFMTMYPSIVDTLLLREREEDYSISSLAIQLFTVRSIASTLVGEHGFLERLLTVLRALMTKRTPMQGCGIQLPPPPADEADTSNPLFREQRCYSLYYALRYLLASEGVQQQLVSDPIHLQAILNFFSLFTGNCPDVRRTGEHLEFESDIWIPVFHVSSHLGRTAKLVGEAFSRAEPQQVVSATKFILDSILVDWEAVAQRTTNPYRSISWHETTFAGGTYLTVQYDVAHEAVSFHHPMHWILAEILQHVQLLSDQTLQPLLSDEARVALLMAGEDQRHHLLSVILTQDKAGPFALAGLEQGWQAVLDFPLRVVVKLAQERVGMWVRNGFALRSQAHHYRGSQMRSIMYNQDLYLLQCGFRVLDERWLVTILDRFGILDFVQRGPQPSDAEADISEEHKLGLVDECLLLLVHLLTEASLCGGWSVPRQIRHELVHFLVVLGPGTWTEITQGVSTRFTDHPSFEHVLTEVSDFHPPIGVNSQGTYELKAECFQEVQPYFVHYTRNMRAKAEEVLMDRYKKANTLSNGKPRPGSNPVEVWAARRPQIEPGTLFSEPQFLSIMLTSPFLSFLAGTILVVRTVKQRESTEVKVPATLVDSLLQLVSAGLACHGFAFVDKMLEPLTLPSQAASNPEHPVASLVVLLCWLEADDEFKSHRAKVSWLLERCTTLAQFARGEAGLARVNDAFRSAGRTVTAAEQEASEQKKLDARRAAARARQSAIMKKFSQQQQRVLQTFDDEDEDTSGSGSHDATANTSGMSQDEATMATDYEHNHGTHDGRPARLTDEQISLKYGSCIMCQEGFKPENPFGMLAHIQQSRTMRILPCSDLEALAQSVDTPLTLDRGDYKVVAQAAADEAMDHTDGPARSKDIPRVHGMAANYSSWPKSDPKRPAGSFPPAFNRPGLYSTTCGHMMHYSCFEMYCQTVDSRHQQQISRQAPENLARLEVVCPLCKALCNALIPLPDSHKCEVVDDQVDYKPDTRTLPDWIRKVNIDILKWSKPIELQESYTGSGTFKVWYADEPYVPLPLRSQTNEPLWEPATESMLLRLLNVTRLQAGDMKELMSKMQQRTILALPSRRMYMPQDLVGYTLSMIEVSQRGRAAKETVVDNVNESTIDLLRGLLHALRLRGMLTPQGENAPEMIRQGLLKRLLPHWMTDDSVRSPLILRDPISILVEAAVIMPQELDHVITLMYYVNLVQLVFGLAQPCMWPPGAAGYTKYRNLFARRSAAATPILPSQPQGSPEASRTGMDAVDVASAREIFPDVRWTVANIIGLVGYARGNISLGVDHLEDDTLAKLLCTHTLPFLRRASILRTAVFGLNSPASPAAPQSEVLPALTPTGEPSEYMRLMTRLAIPLPSSALPARSERQTSLVGIIDGWIKHAYMPLVSLFQPLPIQYSLTTPAVGAGAGGPHHLPGAPIHPILLLEHTGLYELVDLPDDLATLVQQTNNRRCSRCGEVPTDPALCLLCGEVVCYQSFCCQSDDGKRGECNRHCDECGGDMGLFFKIRTNVILALCKGNGTFIASPYLDSHGEVDIGLRKGRIQRLHRQRYDDLRKQWLSHDIPNTVARKIEATHGSGGWSTF